MSTHKCHSSSIVAKFCQLRLHSLLVASYLVGSNLIAANMVFAASPTPGTVIENQATGSFVDTSDNSNKVVESNTVSVTVTEVAGITITPVNTPTATNGSIANFDFSITNVGNDPTKFFLPKDPSSVVGGTAGTMQVVGYIPAGGSQVNLATPINIAAAGDTGALSDPTLGGNTTLGSIPAGAAIVVRVPVTVGAAGGSPVTVTLGNTAGQPSASNTPYVLGANGTGSGDVYTVDNANGAVTGEAAGMPINGDATNHRQEASATQTVNAVASNNGTCSPDGKVWVSGDNGQIGYYQVSTNAFTTVANGQGIVWGDIGWGSNNKLYGVSYADASGPNALYEINSSTGAYTQIKNLATVGAGIGWNSLSGLPDATLIAGTGDYNSPLSSTVYRINLNNIAATPTIWHNFGSGGPSGDFVLFNGKIYVIWTTITGFSASYSLYEVTVDANYNYVSHQNLGALPTSSFGLALVANKLYISANNTIYRINTIPTSPVSTISTTAVSSPPYNTYGATGVEEPFGGCSTPTLVSISGTVFEDPNYGGGAGRPLSTPTTSPRDGATVELYKSDGTYVSSTTTSGGGKYTFSSVDPGDYFVRVVNSTVTSSRPGTGTILPVQTFRVDDSTGTPANDVNRVGGEKPSVADTGAAGAGAVLSPTTFAFTKAPTVVVAGGAAVGGQAQSIAPVKVGSSAVTGIDFGYNFDTIVNNNDSGQGSLRQFVLNSNTLPNSGLAQVGQPAGKEVSIFMIPNGSGTPGLRAGLLNQLTTTGGNSGAAVIKLLSNLTITDSNTSLDATTQTTNVGDSNGGTVGTGGTVGVDKLPLSTVPRPEVVLDFTTVPANSNAIIIMGGSTLLQGFASYGYRSTGNLATTLKGAIVVKSAVTDANAATIRQLLGGTMADGSKPSVPASTVGYTFQTEGSANISNNFLAYNSDAIEFDNTNGSKVDFSNNELAYNGPQDNNGSNGSGIYADQMETGNNVRNITLRGNLVRNSSQPNYANAQGQGLQISTGSTFITVDNNTFTDNNVYGVNASASDTTITKNIITGTKATGLGRGNGIVVYYGGGTGLRNLISQNSLYQNASLGIDLGANVAVNANDGKVSSSSANNGMDYPIITSSALSSGTLRIKGFVGSDPAGNATFAGAKLEFFVADDDGNQNGPVIINDGKAKPHGEGKTFIGDCTANNMGLFDCSFTLGSITLTNPNNITATATDAAGNTSEFGAVFSDPNILLVKRITAINGGTTTRNGDDLALYYNTTSPYDDNVPESTPFLNQPNPNQKDTTFWPTPASFLLGGLNGGNIKPHDEMEYTIYFLSTGDTTANKVEFCDRIPANQTFVPTAFNNITAGTGGLKAADRGILVSTNNNLRAYTNLADGDLARYYAPDESLPTSCGTGTNSNGAIVVNLGTIPNATAPGLPADSHGFVRFRVRIQ